VRERGAVALIASLVLWVSASAAGAAVTTNQIPVPRPVMGWASWNTFASVIDEAKIKAQVDAFVAAGLPAAGYRYINIDEGWWQGARDGAGNIVVDAGQWPAGMAGIASYIHSKGLLAGIYTDAGKNGCGFFFPTGSPAAPNTGAEGHYVQDLTQFARWGFDFVKIDWCGGDAEGLDPQATFQAIRAALATATATTGHPMVLSICEWGRQNPWNWGAGLGAMWRAATDLIFFGQAASLPPVLSSFDQAQHPVAQHTGFVNDPDMLTVGMSGLSAAQSQTELSLWAVSGAPLLAGNNLATMTATTAAILNNAEVIAIDQDPRGLPSVKLAEDSPGLQVHAKVLAGSGRRAVVLLNRTASAAPITVRWTDLGLTSAPATVRNVWAQVTMTNVATSFQTTVAASGSALLVVTGTEAAATTYEAESSANTRTGSATVATCAACSGGGRVGSIGSGAASTLRFNGVAATRAGLAVATIAYTNGDAAARTATLAVNGQVPTTVAFPPTGAATTPGTVSVIVALGAGTGNALTFSSAPGPAPELDAIAISPLPGSQGAAVVGAQSGRCLDVNNNTITNGTQTQLWDCSGGTNQTWISTARKQLVVYGNKCLDASGAGTTNGTPVIVWDCNGQANQQWNLNASGTITSVASGLCLDASGAGTANGTHLILWACGTGANQQWSTR
jgi:alpha galactosidase A-like protein/ricin-type beta-trefoil lectin protein/alpha-galactosidase-like CBM13-containing protein/alpha galactosidase C-like protein